MARWPVSSLELCSVEQLADSLAGYLLSGEATPGEVWALTCCAFHLAIANLLAQLAGDTTRLQVINRASWLRVAARTSASDHRAAA
jgi:hypothetical protein